MQVTAIINPAILQLPSKVGLLIDTKWDGVGTAWSMFWPEGHRPESFVKKLAFFTQFSECVKLEIAAFCLSQVTYRQVTTGTCYKNNTLLQNISSVFRR